MPTCSCLRTTALYLLVLLRGSLCLTLCLDSRLPLTIPLFWFLPRSAAYSAAPCTSALCLTSRATRACAPICMRALLNNAPHILPRAAFRFTTCLLQHIASSRCAWTTRFSGFLNTTKTRRGCRACLSRAFLSAHHAALRRFARHCMPIAVLVLLPYRTAFSSCRGTLPPRFCTYTFLTHTLLI